MKRFLLIPLFVAFWVTACSAAQKGGILDQRGPCGGDGLETECGDRCCPNGMYCAAPGKCMDEKPGPKYLGQ